MVIAQYDIYLISLDPAVGHEIRKTRPCVVLSPNEMNFNISTVIIAAMTTTDKAYPTRVPIHFRRKRGWIALDHIRTVDKIRLIKKLGHLEKAAIVRIKNTLREMLVE
jgi:mRNA interferase MazF